MSKSNPSDIKVAVPTPGAFAGLKALNLQVFVMIAAIIVIMLFFTWMTDGSYLSARNVSNLLRQTAITGILAVGMVFVIISAEIDLSVGSMMGLLGGVAAIFDVWLGWPLPLTVAVTLVLGLVLGAWNGWWVAYRKVPSFIVTLAGMLAWLNDTLCSRILLIMLDRGLHATLWPQAKPTRDMMGHYPSPHSFDCAQPLKPPCAQTATGMSETSCGLRTRHQGYCDHDRLRLHHAHQPHGGPVRFRAR